MWRSETNVSTLKKETPVQAWFSGSQKNARRPRCAEAQAQKRSKALNARVRKVLKSGIKRPKVKSVCLEDEFRKIFKTGKKIRGTFLNFWVLTSSSSKELQLGILVSRKVSSLATVRNLWKRRIREVFRRNQHTPALEGKTVLVQVKTIPAVPAFDEIETEIMSHLQRKPHV